MKPGDFLKLNDHIWRVRGIHLGAVGTESVIEVECLTHKPGCHCREITSLRSVIEAQAAENERLRIAAGDAREKYATSYFRAAESRTAWRARAEQAERALTNEREEAASYHKFWIEERDKRIGLERELAEAQAHLAMRNSDLEEAARALAEAAEVLRPFTLHYSAWMDQHDPETQSSTFPRHTFAQLNAARQFVKEHGK